MIEKNPATNLKNFDFHDGEFASHLLNENNPNQANIVNFLTHLAVCHTVTQQRTKHKVFVSPPTNRAQPVVWKDSYSASSPDELALVNAASHFGIRFVSRPSKKQIIVEYNGKKVGGLEGKVKSETFEVLHILEFTSHRKRMSIVIKTKNGQLKVLTKGSDCVLKKLLAPINGGTDEE